MLKLGMLEIELHPISVVYSDGARGVLTMVRNRGGITWLRINCREFRIAHGLTYYLVKTYDGSIAIEGEEGRLETRLELSTPRAFKIYIVPNVHTDIGYTDLQDRVAEIHRENIRKVLKIVDRRRSEF